MTVTLVCDPSEAMELCASQQLYLKPVARLTISVVLPEHTGSPRTFSKWEVMDKLKNMICPDQFTSVKVAKSTKGFIRFEGEAETKRLVCSLKEKLHGKMIKLNGFKDDLQVMATEASSELPVSQGLEPVLNNRELLGEDFADQSKDNPNCIHLEGLPCKWFAVKGSDSESPSEDVLRSVFESFGKVQNVDIPMLDPYREETVSGSTNNFTFRGLRTFEAFIQYQETSSFSKAMETLRGMKLMFKGDDGKALACNIKVTPDATNHFSESSINQRNLERLTLQGLERERKREENRGKKATERKRRDDDDEKKGGEGKRKSKIKRREKRQIDRDEKRPRKQQKVTAGEELWPENMPEWEERKYLLAQRRVESIRLLTVLLNQIKNFVLSTRQIGEPVLDLDSERESCFPTRLIQNSQKEPSNSCYLEYRELRDERETESQSVQLDDAHFRESEEELYMPTGLPPSPRPLVRTVLNEPLPRAITSLVTDSSADCYRACGLLQVTVTQDCKAERSPDRTDCRGPTSGYFSKASSPPGKCKKQKVYETEEFIHYLLNYYQTPRYARICPGSQSASDASWWQRVVSCKGNGFQVNLKNQDGQGLSEEGLVSDPEERDSREDEDWEVVEEEPKSPEIMPKNQARKWEFTKNYGARYRESMGALSDQTPPEEDNSPGWVSRSATSARKPPAECLGTTVRPSQKALGHVHKLKDLLEEISSDSEYFSEALTESQSKPERRNGGCQSGCQLWSLGPQKATELLICVQNVAQGEPGGEYSQRSFCSSADCCDAAKRPRRRLKAACKRSSSKTKHAGQKVKWPSSDEEREDSRKKKKKKRSSGRSLPDGEARLLKARRGGELESFGKLQRKYSKMLHHKMKCKSLHAVAGSVKAKDVIHFGNSQLQDSRQEAGGLFLRREVEGECEGWPLFPVEIIQTSPSSESVCGAELGRGC